MAGTFRPLTITLTPQHYPFWSRTRAGDEGEVKEAFLIARGTGALRVAKPDGADPDDLGTLTGDLKQARISDPPPFTGSWSAALTADGIEDAWLLVRWGRAG